MAKKSAKNQDPKTEDKNVKVENGLSDFAASLGAVPGQFNPSAITGNQTLTDAANPSLYTLNRVALNNDYAKLGIVTRIIDQPIEDAFRCGVELESDQLSAEDLERLTDKIDEENDWDVAKSALRWMRLFGGGGIVIETDQPHDEEFSQYTFEQNDKLRFIAADRWELTHTQIDHERHTMRGDFMYYGCALARTRVLKLNGKEAPSFIAPRLMGWGLSVLEGIIRDINSFLKIQNVIFELLDESKIDVVKLNGFMDALLSAAGSNRILQTAQVMASIKNFKSMLVLDKEDEFEQKQIAYSGLAEIHNELRLNLCSSVGFPMTKLFGLSASGFSSGKEDLENYNAIVEHVRSQIKRTLRMMAMMRAKQLFGFYPEIRVKFKPLAIMSAVEEEQVKTSKQARVLALYDKDLLTDRETDELLRKEDLLDIQTDIQLGLREADPMKGQPLPDFMGGGVVGGNAAESKDGKRPPSEKEPSPNEQTPIPNEKEQRGR